jgi:hypothetical protein
MSLLPQDECEDELPSDLAPLELVSSQKIKKSNPTMRAHAAPPASPPLAAAARAPAFTTITHACTPRQAAGATAEDAAAAMELYLWPDGAGRTWPDWQAALADVTIAIKNQGLPKVLSTKQDYWDSERQLLKKLVIKCPRSGQYRGQKLEDVRVEGGRSTSTEKCGCLVHINIKVDRSGIRIAASYAPALSDWHVRLLHFACNCSSYTHAHIFTYSHAHAHTPCFTTRRGACDGIRHPPQPQS